jgi:tRNA wybutosine-synthesizing protein 1
MRQRLLYGRVCYKETFYGIESHRCLQMTPTLDKCTQNCLFCWRVKGFSDATPNHNYDEPEMILEESTKAQKPLISGFKGDERCDEALWNEALKPNQVAISLTGEPTLYPYLGDFIELCHKKGMTTFLVTNGTTPEILEELSPLPTQLYVTVAAPNEKIHRKLCSPMVPNAWKKLNRTLNTLPSLDTRRVIRHTLVDGWNIGYEAEYAKLDKKAEPLFVEPKGFVFVGGARQRMSMDNMPSHKKVRDFAEKLGVRLGFKILMEREDSRVVLLGDDPNLCKI